MRDAVILALLAAGLVATLRKPAWGALVWVFIGVSSLHEQGYTTATMPVAAAVAACILLSILIHRPKLSIPWYAPVAFMGLFTIWMTITYLVSPSLEENYEMWIKVIKINLFNFVVLALLRTRDDLDKLIWTIVLALGVTGSKGGVFTLVTGGNYRVWGPGGFIGGNNEFALALIMTIPLMYYLRSVTGYPKVRQGLLVAMVLCAIAAIGSHSRGALLAILAMAIMIVMKGNRKFLTGSSIALLGTLLVAFMPDNWSGRMATIETYDQDQSAMGRINAWIMAWNLALDHFFGSSFENVKVEYFAKYAPDTSYIQGPHSIYFQTLGQHGFVGLALFLGIGIGAWICASRIVKLAHTEAGHGEKDVMLANMIKVSMVGFGVGGAFLALAYFDVPYYLMIVLARLKEILENPPEETPASQHSRSAVGPKVLNRSVSG